MAAHTPPWVCHEGDVLACWRANRECGRKGSALRLLYTAASPSLNMQDSLHGHVHTDSLLDYSLDCE